MAAQLEAIRADVPAPLDTTRVPDASGLIARWLTLRHPERERIQRVAEVAQRRPADSNLDVIGALRDAIRGRRDGD